MKKQFLALAAATAFASASMAASVDVYGTVDLGLSFNQVKKHGSTTRTLKEGSGLCTPSKWGLTGKEDLGNGYSASFKLESAVNADTGAMKDRLFHREARLTLGTPFGDFSFGRMGSMTSSAGTYDIFMGLSDVFDGGWGTDGDAIGASNFFYTHSRFDNMVTYASPKMAGFNVYAQYSFKNNDVDEPYKTAGTEGKPSADRYMGVGATYANGPFTAVAVLDSIRHSHNDPQYKNSTVVSVGGNYDFGACKVFAAFQWGDNEKALGYGRWKTGPGQEGNSYMKGYTFHVGASAPICGGDLKGGAYYSQVKDKRMTADKIKVYNLAATYEYHLSKRTDVYVGAGYAEAKFDLYGTKEKNFDVAVGLNHKF